MKLTFNINCNEINPSMKRISLLVVMKYVSATHVLTALQSTMDLLKEGGLLP